MKAWYPMKWRRSAFAERMLDWHAKYGRHHLPWQQLHRVDKDIYAVWLSEIMLQQTQVSTVLDYYERFRACFITVQALADADWQAVSALWAGLGYYARARNLHVGARQLADIIERTGDFPKDLDTWLGIKGVGRSTAGAIMAMGVGAFGVICDGNVKRVLTRWAGIKDDVTKSATDRALWALATKLTPQQDSGIYAQAMMDLGSTVCTRTRPKCAICPVQADCTAHHEGNPSAYPVKRKKMPKPHHHSRALVLHHGDRVLWLRRPQMGIWGGLWCLPIVSNSLSDPFNDGLVAQFLSDRGLMSDAPLATPSPMIKHALTHFYWHLGRVDIRLDDSQAQALSVILEAAHADYVWQNPCDAVALPKAVIKLLSVPS